MPKPPPLSDQLRTAVRLAMKHRGVKEGRIAREAGVDPAVLWRFIRGETELLGGNLDKLAASLGLRLTTRSPTTLVPPKPTHPKPPRPKRPTAKKERGNAR
ncbi:MAG: helix-turn-helix transcriptional regulator [Planctomycetota bacterium]